MKTENQVSPSLENIQASIDPVEKNSRIDGDKNPGLPLEALVISNSGLCSFMGARSPWANS